VDGGTDFSEEELARLKPKNFQVRWFTKKNDQVATDDIKTHDLLMDVSIKQVAIEEPRMLSGEKFRGSIKNQFKLLSLPGGKKFQFLKM
jgi:hypothetical protein